MRQFRFQRLSILLALVAQGVFCLSANAARETVLLDFPLGDRIPTAAWMPADPLEIQENASHRIEIPVGPLTEGERMVFTAVFFEQQGTSIRVWWEPDSLALAPVRITENLAEGIHGWNLRSFRLPEEIRHGAGLLLIETSGPQRVVHRLVCSLLEKSSLFTHPARSGDESFLVDGELRTAENLLATAWEMPPDAWFGNMIEAYLHESPESTKGGVEFSLEIRPAPQRALLHFSTNGAQRAPEIWVNGTQIGEVSVEVPGFRSPGYVQTGAASTFVYAGWRKGWVLLPPGVLKTGENSILFSTREEEGFVREARLEMWYDSPLIPPPANEIPEIFQEIESSSLPTPPSLSGGNNTAPPSLEPPLPRWQNPAEPAPNPAPRNETLENEPAAGIGEFLAPPASHEDPLPEPSQLFRTSLR